jgi:hypothetical protein
MAAPMAVDFDSHGCIYNYHVTAHKPTAVTHCVVGSFTGANENNLIIAYVQLSCSCLSTTQQAHGAAGWACRRRNHIEISTFAPEGLKVCLDSQCNCVTSLMQSGRVYQSLRSTATLHVCFVGSIAGADLRQNISHAPPQTQGTHKMNEQMQIPAAVTS